MSTPHQEPLTCALCGAPGDTASLDYCEHCCEMICADCFISNLHQCPEED